MSGTAAPAPHPEHADFYARFQSFWAAPAGTRVPELIAPDATIHFSGLGKFSGAEYVHVMQEILDNAVEMTVTPLDYAGAGEMLYIAWETVATLHGERRTYRGVDRFRIQGGMAVEEHVVFDTAVLGPEGAV